MNALRSLPHAAHVTRAHTTLAPHTLHAHDVTPVTAVTTVPQNESKMESTPSEFYGTTLVLNVLCLCLALSVSDLSLVNGLNGAVCTNRAPEPSLDLGIDQ